MQNVIPFPGPDDDGDESRFERRRRAQQGPSGEPLLPKWRRDRPAWFNRFLDAVALYAVLRFEFSAVHEEASAEDELLVEKIAPNLWYATRKSNRPKYDPETTVFCSCGNQKRKQSRKRGVCPSCGLPKKPSESPRVIVEYVPEDKRVPWQCNCSLWIEKRYQDCSHIRMVKRVERIEGTYSSKRRRTKTEYVYRRGTLGDDQRMAKAREEIPFRVPRMIACLAKMFVPKRERGANGGATGIQDSVIVLGMAGRSLLGTAYEIVRRWMALDKTMMTLGHRKPTAPSARAFSEKIGKAKFPEWVVAMLPVVAELFIDMDPFTVGDSYDNACRSTYNSLDDKADVKPASFRSMVSMPRTHFSAGVYSQAFYAVQASPTDGKGSGDDSHFIPLMRETHRINPNARKTAWDRAYRDKALYRLCQELGVDLVIPEKLNEDTLNPKNKWPPMAVRLAKLQREDPEAFFEDYRFRTLGERPQSGIKGRKNHVRSRKRKHTDPRIDMAEVLKELDLTDDDKLSELAEEKLAAVHEAAEMNVGFARLGEVFMDALVHSLICVIRWEHRFGVEASFGNGFKFPPLIVIREADIPDEAAAEALLRKIELEYGHLRRNELEGPESSNNGLW